jgi:hypothetical protein
MGKNSGSIAEFNVRKGVWNATSTSGLRATERGFRRKRDVGERVDGGPAAYAVLRRVPADQRSGGPSDRGGRQSPAGRARTIQIMATQSPALGRRASPFSRSQSRARSASSTKAIPGRWGDCLLCLKSSTASGRPFTGTIRSSESFGQSGRRTNGRDWPARGRHRAAERSTTLPPNARVASASG